MQIELRPVQPEDEQFLYKLYYSVREHELAGLGWEEAAKHAFLQMQFNAQQTHYQTHRALADCALICYDGQPIGQLFVDREDDNIHLLDISLLPEYRNRGLGTRFVQDVVTEADAKGQTTTLYVHTENPAIRLYERFDFKIVNTTGLYYFMQRQPRQIL